MNQLRLAFISPRLPSGNSVGGAETLLKHHASLAAELGHKVSFLTTCATDHFSWKNDVEPGTRTVDGLEVSMFPVDEDRDLEVFLTIQESIMKGRAVSEVEERAWLDNGINSTDMTEHLNKHSAEYDLIIAGPYLFGLTVSALEAHRGKSVLVPCLHDEPFARLNVFRKLIGEVKGIFFNTSPEREFAKKLVGDKLPPNEVVGFSIPCVDADPKLFRNILDLSKPYVIYSGRREPMKGTPLLMDYMRTFRNRTAKDVALVLTGKGQIDFEEGDRSWAHDVGFLSEEEKLSAMSGAVTFCHPSTFESLGIVLLESWMAGAPCLVHAGSEVLKDQCARSNGGLWFRCYPDFEEELNLLLENSSLRSTLSRNGRDFVQKEYSKDAAGRRLGAIIDRLAKA